MEQNNCFNEK